MLSKMPISRLCRKGEIIEFNHALAYVDKVRVGTNEYEDLVLWISPLTA